jgi:hypothetical protein
MGWQDDTLASTSSNAPAWASDPVANQSGGTEIISKGQEQAKADEELVKKNQGFLPEEVKTFGKVALNTAALNAPLAAESAYEAHKSGRPFDEVYQENKDYLAALERRNPKSSMAGTATGIVAPMFVGDVVPGMAALARGSTSAAKAIGLGETGQAIARGTTLGGVGSGVASGIENLSTEKPISQQLTNVIPSVTTGGVTGAVLGPAAEKLVGKLAGPAEAQGAKYGSDLFEKAITGASGGRLSAEDVQAIAPKLEAAFAEKGATPAVAREVLATEFGAPVSREMATGIRAPAGTPSQVAAESRMAADEALGRYAAGQQTALSPTAQAEALHAAERAEHGIASQAQEDLKKIQGGFHEWQRIETAPDGTKFVQKYGLDSIMMPEIKAALQANGLPENLEAFPKAQEAQKYLINVFQGKQYPYGGNNLQLKDVVSARNLLNKKLGDASDAERTIIKTMVKGYDNAVERAMNENLFTGNSGEYLLGKNVANSLWSNYMKKYVPENTIESNAFNHITKSMAGTNGYVADTLNPGMAQAAQSAINTGIMDPKVGLSLYKRIENNFGANSPQMDTFRAAIRNNIFNVTKADGTFDTAQLAKQIDAHLQPGTRDITLKAFGAKEGDPASMKAAQEQLANLKRLREAVKIINKQPETELVKHNRIVDSIASIAPKFLGAMVGQPHGAVATAVGAVAGDVASKAGSAAKQYTQALSERAGAPAAKPSVGPSGMEVPWSPFGVYPGIKNVGAMMPVDKETGYGPPTPMPVARKSGGRVGGMTADQLLSAVERAKKKTSGNTKPLLGLHDNQVAKALEIANHKI